MQIIKTRICKICNKKKKLSEFYKDKTSKGGHRIICKKCVLLKIKEDYKQFPEKRLLIDIRKRCTNKNRKEYKWYGGRGIKCLITEDEIRQLMIRDGYWDMKKPSIDRIDNDGDYTYDNCQFIELSENTIKRNNLYKKIIQQFDLQGNFIKEWESITEISKKLNVSMGNICTGLKTGRMRYNYIWNYK